MDDFSVCEYEFPLSFAQQRLWFLAQFDEGSTTYHIPLSQHLHGSLDVAAWQRSLDRLFARHEALRSIFVMADGVPHVELLPPDAGLPLIKHDLRDRSDARELVERLLAEEAHTPFDLAQGPLVRARLIRIAEQEHVFLLTQHHIVSDGWSMGVLVRELNALYRAFLAGQEDPLPPLTIQYPDYAVWQRQWLSGERLQNQVEYWRRNLADAPVLLTLPTDRPRPVQQSFAGAVLPVQLDAELTRGLKQLSRQHGTTLFMTILATWSALLSRLSGQDDVVIGVPTANRGRREIEGLIGFFVNTLALRLDLSGNPSVADLLDRARRTALAAQDHQDLPFEQVVEIVQPPRRLDHTPVFQVMFAWQNNEGGAFELPGLRVEAVGTAFRQAKFDLQINLSEAGDHIVGGLRYATALFDEATIERHRGYLLELLRGMVADARQPIGQLDILPPDEREYLLEKLNRTAAEYPAHLCIHELFEEQVRKAPEAVALVCGDESLSYGELNARANRLAHHLIAQGVKPDDRVAICVERSVGMVVGLLAILKAGGAYVPLDPAYPSERLAQVLQDAAPKLLVCDGTGRTALGHDAIAAAAVIEIDAAAPAWASQPGSDPDPHRLGLTSRHLAYVIYTSGSTGTPKGAQNEHRAIINRLIWMQQAYSLNATDAVLQKTPFSFDVSVWEFFWTLGTGARLVLAPPEAHKDPYTLTELITNQRISTVHFVPSMLASFIDTAGVNRCTSLQRVICSGEALPASSVHKVRRALPLAGLHNLYGPTEAAIDVTAWSCPDDFAGEIVPIGRPISNTRIYLLDGFGQPVPLGVAGELYIGGAGVARGYLNRPDLTAERFLEDPFSAEPGARMYRTGDLARYLPDGNVEFLGRNDDQVKIRGFRIEPGEIEARLSEHGAVREAVVVAREDRSGEKRLVAYVVCGAGETAAESEAGGLAGVLRSHLSARLPDYMVPSAFVRLDGLPLTPNGKLDRKALPAPEDDAYAHQAYEAPQGEVETALAAIWSELLGVERVGRHDNFFELGGHSLLAVQLLERLRRLSLGTDVRSLFVNPVLSDLAATLGNHGEVAVPANLITAQSTAITPQMLPLIELTQAEIDSIVAKVPGGISNIQDIYALSPLQDGILFHHLLAEQGDPYLLISQLRFAERGLLERYLEAVQQVVDRHDILRTAFVWEGLSSPAQVVWRHAPLMITEVELDPAGGPGPEQLARRFNPRQHRIDLTQAPLLRFVVAREPGSGRWLLLQLLHHLIGDHSTLEVMHAEVQAVLGGRGDELAPPQPFRNLVAHARLGVPHDEHERFFRSMLADIDEPTLPFGLREVHGDGSGISEFSRMLPAELHGRLRTQARRLGVSLASLCHLAWGQVIARSSGREQVVFGTVLFGRMHAGAGADRTMGLFINTLPLRLDLDGSGIEERVRTTHARLAELLAHEHASLALAQRCSGVAAPAPLFSALLNYRHNAMPAASSRGGADDPWRGIDRLGGAERTNYPVTLSVNDFGRGLGLTAQVVEPLSPERVCGYMQRALEQLAEALERSPAMPVRQLDILPPDEREYLLEKLNRTAAEYPAHLCIHELFEEQVRKAPEAVALVCGDESLSYGELNARANRLAHHLIAQGVKPDDRVAICVERSVGMVVGLLAILKAGGAYVPLDPAYPSERLAQVLQDAAPKLLVCDGTGRTALGHDAIAAAAVIEIDAAAPAWASQPGSDPDPHRLGLTSRHLAYVIYTSGSTGTPKGAQNEHRAIINRLIWMQQAYSLNATDAVLQKTPFSFDVSVWEFFWTLGTGARLVLAPPEAHKDPYTLTELITNQRISTVHFVPSMLASFIDTAGVNRCTSLQRVICSGEALPASSVHKVRRALPLAGLHNLYGPTEAAIDVTAWSCPDDFAGEIVPIGRPISNTRIYLLDGFGQPVPLGVAGELYIGGAGVARGYLNRPDLTAERFLEDPFSAEPGARMYRTGDLARYLPDGNIEFLGRNDDQVKIRGFRIEPGEIEARLSEHGAVREAVVVAREDRSGEKRLVAYVVCGAGETAAESEAGGLAGVLRSHLSARLPDYMVPSAFVRLDGLPLTPNGKLDRKALPAPEDDAYAHQAYEAPQGEVETALAAIWSELLGVERVGRHDDFFELGGHSLLAVQLLERLRRLSLGTDVRSLFVNPVLSDLAASLGSHGEVPSSIKEPNAKPLSNAPQKNNNQFSAAVPIRLSGAEMPIFFVPTGQGDYSYVARLADELDVDCPIYAVRWQDPTEIQLTTLEGMATRMISIIKGIQPRGPYRLAGYSSGGMLAYAIAQHLLMLDEAVSSLNLIDISPSRIMNRQAATSKELLTQYAKQTDEPKYNRHIEITSLSVEDLSLIQLIKEYQRFNILPHPLDPRHESLIWEQRSAFWNAVRSYQAPALPIDLHLFQAIDSNSAASGSRSNNDSHPSDPQTSSAGWEFILSPSQIHVTSIPGSHTTIISDPANRTILIKQLSNALQTQFAAHEKASCTFEPLVSLRDGRNEKAALLCIPGAGATVMSFIEVVSHLANSRKIYGLQPRGIDSSQLPHGSVEAATKANLEALTKLHEGNSFHLLGHSHGGRVAFEMARSLQEIGCSVASLTLIDSEPPDNRICDVPDKTIFREFANAIRHTYGQELPIDEIAVASGLVQNFLASLHGAMVKTGILPVRSTPATLKGSFAAFAAARRSHYLPAAPYIGKMQLIQARDPDLDPEADMKRQEHEAAGWRAWADELTVSRGPGNHFAILRAPHAREVASWWQETVGRA